MKRGWIRWLLNNRLLQFLALGGAIFAIAPRAPSRGHINLSRSYLESLHTQRANRDRASHLSVQGAAEVDARAIQDEVLFREALRLGLDQGDLLIRQHLIQKTLMLAEDLGGGSRLPTEVELRTYYQQNPPRWSRPAHYHFIHVYSATAERAQQVRPDVAALGDSNSVPALGDAFPFSRDVMASADRVSATFGPAFAEALTQQRSGQWVGPLASKYGWHWVKILEVAGAGTAPFEEVREKLSLDYSVERRQRAVERFLQQAMRRYRIDVEGAPLERVPTVSRIAVRSEPSAED